MTKKMHIHWDPDADHLEVRFGEPRNSYYRDLGDDIFERVDEDTGKVIGYTFFNVQKRKQKKPQDIAVDIPDILSDAVVS